MARPGWLTPGCPPTTGRDERLRRGAPMSGASASELIERQRSGDLHAKWGWFLALGIVLTACGALAVALPAISAYAASVVLGAVLAIAGIVKMIQSLQVKAWSGFIWQELTGAVELVGGVPT